MISAILAIYGAILSTTLAFIQIGNFQRSKKYLETEIGRSYTSSDELVEFKISNRSVHKTEIQNIMIGICEMSDGGFVRSFAARGFDPTKSSHFWDREGDDINFPFSLSPGESIYVTFSSTDANNFISEDRSYLQSRVLLANVFEFEIEHSQGNPLRACFSMDPRHLKHSEALTVPDFTSLIRSRIWKLNKAPQ